jgi:halimadienyl-diphosphate synthase
MTLRAVARDRRSPFADLLGIPGARPGIAGTAYDTAWLASVPAAENPHSSRFPTALQWLVEHQHPDGSWGGAVEYHHDRVVSTLAALAALKQFGRRASDVAAIEAGTRYLWQHGHRMMGEPMELVGFELLVPSLVQHARAAGVAVPSHLDVYAQQREHKLRLIPSDALYSTRTTIVHSIEFLGDQVDPLRLRATQGANGAVGNSPAATAYFLRHTLDGSAARYLEECLEHGGGATAPVLHPCDTFELLWAAYHLHLAGVPARDLLGADERAALARAVKSGGVSLSPSFPIPDADDTAVALLLLHDIGEQVDPSVLQAYEQPDGHFVSFPFERHGSVGANLHVLHALLRVPGYPNQQSVVERLVDYLAGQHNGLYWLDKWHISPLYATAHALNVLAELPEPLRERIRPCLVAAREWLRHTQNDDGSWGFYGRPTAEETAYALLALASGAPDLADADDRARCVRAANYLRAVMSVSAEPFPPLWIDKCLYTPTLVVRSVIQAALHAQARARWVRLLSPTSPAARESGRLRRSVPLAVNGA